MENKTIRWHGMIIISVFFIGVFVIGLYHVRTSRAAMEARYTCQQKQIVELEQTVSGLEDTLQRVGTDGYVENQAREDYSYTRDGELLFEFSDPGRLDNYTEEEWNVIMDEGLYPTY